MAEEAITTRDDARNDPRLQDADLMLRFARQWHIEPDRPYQAVAALFPNTGRDINVICLAVEMWREHPTVLEERDRLAALGAATQLPTKEQVALELWKTAQRENITTSDRLALIREFNVMMGHHAPKNSNVSLIDPNGMVNRVMRVPDQGPEAAWHERAQKQQAGLIDEASTSTQH